MENQPGKRQLLAVVLAIASIVFGQRAVSPALADIAKAFPDRSTETIQLVATMPSLLMMVSTLICGQLSRRLGKRTLVLIGIVVYVIGGISPAFFGGLTFVLIMMGVLGAGNGFLVPISQSLIADYFEGREREIYLGYRSSTAATFGMAFSMLGGYLCAIHWRYTFYSFALALPVLLFILAKMPAGENRQATQKNRESASLTGKTWFYIGMYFLYNVAIIALVTNAAFAMTAGNIGNARTIGIVMTISSVGTILAGFVLGPIGKWLKDYTLVAALAFLALGFIALNYADTALLFTVATALWGFGFGIFNPTIAMKIIDSVPKAAATLALSVTTCAMGIGQFISPIAFSFVNGMIGLEGPRASFVVAAVCFTGAFVVTLVATALVPPKANVAVSN